MKISEILWRAANECLWDGRGESGEWEPMDKQTAGYSCDAVRFACQSPEERYLCEAFLIPFGCPVYAHMQGSLTAFEEFDEGEERQGARYLWLDFARLVAEVEGL